MQFLFPWFFWALLSLSIPIIIHLFYFRRFKKVFFTNVRFLKEIKEETTSRSRIKNLLVLLSRILALIFLVAAFVQPFIPKQVDVKQGEKAVSVFVDNSYSMSALAEDVDLLENAKRKASEIVKAYGAEDRFQILTQDFEGRHQRLVSKDEAITLINEIKTSPSVQLMAKVLNRQKQILGTSKTDNRVSYIISDFQKNTANFNSYKDSLVQVNLVPLQPVQLQNISIDSCWFEMPIQMLNQTNNLFVKITNHSPETVESVKISLKYDGQDKPVGSSTIPGNSSIVDTVSITTLKSGWHEAVVNIADYPVQFDDNYYVSFDVADKINVGLINDGNINRYVNALFNGIGYFNVSAQSSSNIDYAKLATYDFIILQDLASISSGLSNELNQFVSNGGNLLIFPPANADINSYKSLSNTLKINSLLGFESNEKLVSQINTEEFVFNDVYINKNSNLKLPQTKGNFRLTNSSGVGEEVLMRYRDGSSFVTKYARDKGNIYLCAAPLDENYNNLVRNAEVFVPMLYKMSISKAIKPIISYTIGKDQVIEAKYKEVAKDQIFKLKGNKDEFIPEQKILGSKLMLNVSNQIPEAGFYNLFLKESEITGKYAYNYDRLESEMKTLTPEELAGFENNYIKVIDAKNEANFTQLIGERDKGITLWKWCLLLALLFLLIESLLLRFFR